ncbi:MAG: lytic murein transglycosylase [Desulfobacteraceae bacterium]
MLKIASIIYSYRTALILAGALFAAPSMAQAADQETRGFFEPLIQRLIADGFNPDQIRQLYSRSDEVYFESRGVSLYFLHNEAKLDYNKMTKRSWIREARVYLKDHAESFKAAEKKFGVDPNVIAAIILVETKFGRYMGNRSILNTLSTMAVLTQPEQRDYLWEQLPEERRYSRNKYDQKADRKSDWAYRELKAYLTYTQRHGIDPAQIKGSYAGALGLAQFMPSNILAYGKDGNGDGKINLFEDADAIFSIASYLRHYGWKPGIDDKKAYKVVYHYNHSKYYVNTILKIRDLLEG